MKWIVAALIVVLVAQTLAGTQAEAQPCTGGGCSFPAQGFILVGRDPANGAAPDPAGEFSVTIREHNVGVPGVVVHVDFSGCPDVRLCENQREGTAVDCLGKRVSVTTNELGVAKFDILGYAEGATPVGENSRCARIVTEPPWLDVTEKVAIYDLAGHNGLAVSDLSVLVGDILNANGNYIERCDYTLNGILQSNDIALLVGAVLRGRSAVGCSSLCP